jgi:DNA-binding transcriptional ArsR family regulator
MIFSLILRMHLNFKLSYRIFTIYKINYMAVNKSEEFKQDEISLSKIAKALAHPARVAIINMLSGKQSCICGDIVDALPLSQSTVSQHLKELKEADLIKGNIDGPRVCYCINETRWKEAGEEINRFLKNISESRCECC